MPKLGELINNVEILRNLRNQLIQDEQESRLNKVENERWGSFQSTASKIVEACEDRDLESLVTAARELKNRLRRPSVRKDLARLESDEDTNSGKKNIPAKDEKNPEGQCRCAKCKKIIDGSKEPCLDGALCSDCALENKVIPKDRQKSKKEVLPAPDVPPGSGMAGGSGDNEGEKSTEEKVFTSLRRRSYLK